VNRRSKQVGDVSMSKKKIRVFSLCVLDKRRA